MTIDYNAAVQAIRRAAMQYQGFVAAADALEKIGSLEQAAKEAEAAVAKARAELAEVQEGIRKAAVANEAMESAAKARAAIVERAADEALANAEAAAEQIIAKAKSDAELVVTMANQQADMSHNAQVIRQELMAEEIAKLEQERAEKLHEAEEARGAAAQAAEQLAQIQASIAKLAGAVN